MEPVSFSAASREPIIDNVRELDAEKKFLESLLELSISYRHDLDQYAIHGIAGQ